ncbi:MAG: Do family serine endopeptidase [Acidiferrobacter sp.]
MRRRVVWVLVGLWTCMPLAWADRGAFPNFARIVAANREAVVNISSTEVIKRFVPSFGFGAPNLPPGSPLKRFFRQVPPPGHATPQKFITKSLGSGLIITANGYILTCAHVINHAKQVIVKLANHHDYVAHIVGLDTKSDVALLKIAAHNLSTVTIGHPSRLRVGDWVLAIGAPFGFENSATAGIVSAKGRNLPGSDYVPFIQTDVPINPGNSGGPLFDLRGHVVGINSQIYSRTGGFMGLSFAIPISLAMRIGHDLRVHGYVQWGWLGVTIQGVTRQLAQAFHMRKPYGALVSAILPHSPAAHSDLRVGDVIVSYRGEPVVRSSDLPPLVGLTPIGTRVRLGVIRNGQPAIVILTIGALPEVVPTTPIHTPPRPQNQATLGLALRNLHPTERQALGVSSGVLVMGVSHGPAERAGIRAGDVILALAGRDVDSVAAFKAILAQASKTRPVPVLVHRDGGAVFLALTLK